MKIMLGVWLTDRPKVNQYYECNHLVMEHVGKCMVNLFMAK